MAASECSGLGQFSRLGQFLEVADVDVHIDRTGFKAPFGCPAARSSLKRLPISARVSIPLSPPHSRYCTLFLPLFLFFTSSLLLMGRNAPFFHFSALSECVARAGIPVVVVETSSSLPTASFPAVFGVVRIVAVLGRLSPHFGDRLN